MARDEAAPAGGGGTAAGAAGPAGAGREARREFLHLVSWNVAAWQTTLDLVVEDQGDVRAFWAKHQADIVCLQEVKITAAAITAQARKIGAFTEDFETFWAPCCEKDPNRKGMQGVATWAKKGLTLRADAHALRDPDLDAMGRCIFTEHHEFVLFNVYAPAGANGVALRMHFYNALRVAMQRERTRTRKPVVLCGDLNLAAGPLDVHYMSCRVDVKAILRGETPCACGSLAPQCCRIKVDLEAWWPAVLRALKTRKYLTETTRSSATNEPRERFRMAIDVPVASASNAERASRQVKIGKLRESTAYFDYVYDFQQRNPAVNEIVELLKAVGDVHWAWREALALSKACGKSPNDPSVLQWFQHDLGTTDAMVDSFRELYPHARNRFTCWDQYTNRRYENTGARIDYFVIDRDLLPRIAQRHLSLRCGCESPKPHPGGLMGHAAAKCAATAAGRFQPAAFSGGGLQIAPVSAIESQFGEPHNGIIYTPPKYSDHVAVSLCLRMADPTAATSVELCANDRATRRAQPHKKQSQITTFFNPGSLEPQQRKPRDKTVDSGPASQLESQLEISAPSGSAAAAARDKVVNLTLDDEGENQAPASLGRRPSASKSSKPQANVRKRRKIAVPKGQSTLKAFLAPSAANPKGT